MMTDITTVASPLAAPAAAAVATTAIATALSAWGSYAIVLIVLGYMLWRSHLDRLKLETDNAALRLENTTLRDKRLEDVQKMISVTESSTALQQTRTQGDQLFLTTMQDLAAEVVALRSSKDGIAGNRQLIEQLLERIDERSVPPKRSPTRVRDSR